MTNEYLQNKPKYCPSCGAPVVSEICEYCGNPTGLDTAKANMNYPVLPCKEATINFWTIGFPLIFAFAFGFSGLTVLLISILFKGNGMLFIIGMPFLAIGIAAAFFVIRTVSRYLKIKSRGKRIQAIVYGYMDDNVMINNRPSQIVKLLIQTSDGPRFILYQLGNTLKIYGINDRIDIMMYQNYFMICKK